MSNFTDGSARGRIFAGLMMGSVTLALVFLTAELGPIGAAALVHPIVELTVPTAVIVTVVIASFSSSLRLAWGRLCLMNGVISIALAGISVGHSQPLWPTDPLYERALDEAVQWWLARAIWTTAAYLATALVIAGVLFALSYWLLHAPHRRHRQAH